MGGGGFSVEPENPLLEDFVLSLARRQPARVCFIPTASGEAATYITKFYRAFSGRALPTDLLLYDSPVLSRNPPLTSDLASFVADQDVIYVGGGNTANMLALWRVHGLDRTLRNAWENGAVLCGVSAGMICWFECSLTDSFGGLEPLNDGLGFIAGSACPHFDLEPGRRSRYRELIASGFPGGYAADDGAAVHFVGKTFKEAVTSRANAAAYRIEASGDQVVEERLATRYLGLAPSR
jgi:dipeptidase E